MFRKSPFDPPSLIERIWDSPLKFLITTLYRASCLLRSSPELNGEPPLTLVCISDTHSKTKELPPGDLLIHAGDLTNAGTVAELQAQIDWLDSQPHTHKVAIAGNHDTFLDPASRTTLAKAEQRGKLNWKSVQYLQHDTVALDFPQSPKLLSHNSVSSDCSSTTPLRSVNSSTPCRRARRLILYGAPQIPSCGGASFAFQYMRSRDAWSGTIPRDVDVLVTHTPPAYHVDVSAPAMGCATLLRETWRVRPLVHICGHVHAGAGREVLWWDEVQKLYERCMGRKTGWFWGLWDVRMWLDLMRMCLAIPTAVMWDRVWGGQQRRTILVNAALAYNDTGELRNQVQVVEI